MILVILLSQTLNRVHHENHHQHVLVPEETVYQQPGSHWVHPTLLETWQVGLQIKSAHTISVSKMQSLRLNLGWSVHVINNVSLAFLLVSSNNFPGIQCVAAISQVSDSFLLVDRHPLLVRRETPTGSVVPPLLPMPEDPSPGWMRRGSRGDPFPIAQPSAQNQRGPAYSIGGGGAGGGPSILPPNPHAFSPYEYAYTVRRHNGTPPPSQHEVAMYDPHGYYPPIPGYHMGMGGGQHSLSSGGTGPSRSQRQLISCYPCRARKLKCDGENPCRQCSRRGSEKECAYADRVRRRGKGKKQREDGESSDGSHSGGGRGGRVDIERGASSSGGTDGLRSATMTVPTPLRRLSVEQEEVVKEEDIEGELMTASTTLVSIVLTRTPRSPIRQRQLEDAGMEVIRGHGNDQ